MEKLSTDLIVGATIRAAAMEGIAVTIIHKGEANSGSLLLKINKLDGSAEVLSQVQIDDEMAWMPASGAPMEERDADTYIKDQISFDPDLWAIEIEDRQGRHWFDGEVLEV